LKKKLYISTSTLQFLFLMKASTWKLYTCTVILAAGILLVNCSGNRDYPITGSVDRLVPELDGVIAPGERPEILAEGFEWSEGPLWLPGQDRVIFSDVPENVIFSWSEKEGLQRYLEPSGYTDTLSRGGETGSNGLLLDGKGQLVLCQHGDRRMAVMDTPPDHPEPVFRTLAGSYQGKRFNSPNDAVFSRNGTLYFTDPAYGMELRYDDPRREMDYTGVFRLDPAGTVSLEVDSLSAPNGIGLSPEEDRLYVANSGMQSGLVWMVYDVEADGSLSDGRLFYDAGMAADSLQGACDGLAVRSDGIIFATGPGGVWVFEPGGSHLGIVRTGQATSNCTLDTDERYLYITADMYLMRIRLLPAE
jgi:gluconolactonase